MSSTLAIRENLLQSRRLISYGTIACGGLGVDEREAGGQRVKKG